MLKLTPDRSFLAEQVAMLRLFAPSGRVPAVLGADLRAGMVVLEAIRPGVAADELAQRPSPQEWAALLGALHDLDAERLHAWSRVVAPLLAIAQLAGGDGSAAVGSATTELLALAR